MTKSDAETNLDGGFEKTWETTDEHPILQWQEAGSTEGILING